MLWGHFLRLLEANYATVGGTPCQAGLGRVVAHMVNPPLLHRTRAAQTHTHTPHATQTTHDARATSHTNTTCGKPRNPILRFAAEHGGDGGLQRPDLVLRAPRCGRARDGGCCGADHGGGSEGGLPGFRWLSAAFPGVPMAAFRGVPPIDGFHYPSH